MKIPPNNIDLWYHRVYDNAVMTEAEHGDYLVKLSPEGWYKPYHIVSALGNEKGYTELIRAASICRIHAIAMLAIHSDLASYEVFTSNMIKLIERDDI